MKQLYPVLRNICTLLLAGCVASSQAQSIAPASPKVSHYTTVDSLPVVPAGHNGNARQKNANQLNRADDMQQVEMNVLHKMVTDQLKLGIPINWMEKEVVFDFYNADGKLMRKVIEHRSATNLTIDLSGLPAGTVVVRASCGKEFAVQQLMIENVL
ncbi:T9SS type A sorting domain-containing protein [Flavihumibacter petaseus]|uniref:Uncharacterized protein n=1 Tax=Flavihumibacter petaseus NBRC 106054 TaxID=1220578 RepID=A0A0E9N5J6_9BACT|nr:T9SS type A sorting domain-containing protein [Flavihumibacter petaseus]GAO45078.1 hypothetical protein FPE01S_04_03210 [Flavihumibacter petaseus NBRC 106054]